MSVLVISTCKEELHNLEFVKPIEDILFLKQINFFTKNYKDISSKDLEKCSKVIICGTSLADFDYFNNLKKFEWIKDFDKPILGICAGSQVLGLIFGEKSKKKTEIGFFQEEFKNKFLGLEGNQEVYHLHNNYTFFSDSWKVFSEGNGIQQAVKHKEKEFYGILFHPEVRNKKMILEFVHNG
jgi:GMP synthase (glutamine-hydrolysing)